MAEQAVKEVQKFEDVDFSFLANPETHSQKLGRKVRENPLVPVGECLSRIHSHFICY